MTIIDLIGGTPLIDLSSLCDNPHVTVLGKMEGQNPGSSVKDRTALQMILGAEARGELVAGKKIIEATSGNTGIALAMIAGIKGYEIELVMPEGSTRERILTMKAFGATVTLTPAEDMMEGAIEHAHEQVKKQGAVMLDQFSNADNPRAHYLTTGPELWQDTHGRITHFVSAMGTTGTVMGVSRYLKEKDARVRIIGVQPAEGSDIPGIRRWPQRYLPAIFKPERLDELRDVSYEEAVLMCRRLAREYGVFCGLSAGGAVAVASEIAREIDSGLVTTIICDRGERYLSSDMFSST